MEKNLIEEIKEIAIAKGKPELVEFVEDIAFIAFDVVSLLVERSDSSIIKMIFNKFDDELKTLIDQIDGKEG
jgi:hypothetical protein